MLARSFAWTGRIGMAFVCFGLLALASPAFAAEASIFGTITNSKNKQPVPNALVILTCSCLQDSLHTQSDADGKYEFKNLEEGTYTVQVVAGEADVSKLATVPPAARFRANFRIKPNDQFSGG